MYNFWSFFISKRQFSILFAIALTLFGMSALNQMPKESNPEVTLPIGIVYTILPGASAIDVEKLITNEIEPQLKNNLDEVKEITSSSKSGVSSIVIEFNASADIQSSIRDLKDEVDNAKANLPEDATEPRVVQVDFAKQPILTFAVAVDAPRGVLLHLSEQLETQLENVRGVASADITGVQSRTAHVLVHKEALTRYGITLQSIVQAIGSQSIALPAGDITVAGDNYPVRFAGDIAKPQEIGSLPITSIGAAPITVADVATVVDGFAEAKTLSRLSLLGAPSANSFTVSVYKKPGSQITQVGESVKEALQNLQKDGELLSGTSVAVTFDIAEELQNNLRTLGASGVTTVLLVISILFFAIGTREALVAGLSIPLSFFTAFIFLKASGNSLNFVSLFALILATGIIVDAAIVVVEAINNAMRSNPEASKLHAARQALAEYHGPLTSGTLTTVAVFAPLFTISGVTGQFIATIPYTIIFVLLASLFVALGLIPVFATLILKRHSSDNHIAKVRKRVIARITTVYQSFLTSFLTQKKATPTLIFVLILFFILSLALPVVGIVRTAFFPGGSVEYAYINVELPAGSTLTDTDTQLRTVEELLYDIGGIASFSVTAGRTSDFANTPGGSVAAQNVGNISLRFTKEDAHRSKEILTTIRNAVAPINSAEILVDEVSDGPPTGAPITITFSGDDFANLDANANQALNILQNISGVSDATASTKDNAKEFVLAIDRGKAITHGITPRAAAITVNTALSGTEATTIKRFGDTIPVIVRMDLSGNKTLEQSNTATIDALRYMPVGPQTGQGSQVLLGSFMSSTLAESRTVVRHEDAERIVRITSNVHDGANAREIVATFKKQVAAELHLAKGVTMSIGGENKDVDQSFADMFTALLMGLTAMFSILVIQFNSVRHATYILLTVPLSLIGVFIGLLLVDKPLSFPAIMGFIALSGIVVNNGIILIDVINHKRAKAMSKSKDGILDTQNLKDVVIAASVARLRPVLLTALTTVVGIIPLIFAAGMWAPLAYSIIFGLSFATVLTLVLLPAIYYKWPGRLHT